MNPMNLARLLPAKARTATYVVVATLVAVENTLDGFDYGVIPDRPQAAILAVLTVLGFGVAAANVTPNGAAPEAPRSPEEPPGY